MPYYLYACPYDHYFEAFMRVANHQAVAYCTKHHAASPQIITPPLMVKAAADVSYDSPIDGVPITSWDQRREDLKRNNCTEYDPECKTDRANRLKDSEAALDKTIDEHVERTIAQMPTAQRGKLYSELTERGVQAEVVRSTPHA